MKQGRGAATKATVALALALGGVGAGGCSPGDLVVPEEAPPATTLYPCAQQFEWPTCSNHPSATTLAEKARYFDRVAREQHLAPDDLLRNLYRTEDLQSVDHWEQHPNVILWSGMYLGAQALRYAVTGEQEALDNAQTVVRGLRDLTDVTGVTGLYGRSLTKPGVPYNFDGSEYAWEESTTPGYEGWLWDNDVSKDGYDGLMFGYATALEHLGDTPVAAEVRKLVAEIAEHLISNGLQIIDVTGEVTEHGRLFQSAMDDFPGFNALLASSWVKVAAWAGDDASMDDFYYGCLMRKRPEVSCPVFDAVDMGPYIDTMEGMLGLFRTDCQQNYDNFDMCYQAIYPLLRQETDPELQQRLLGVLRSNMFHTTDPEFQSIAEIGNSMFTFMYAGLSCDGPDEVPFVRRAVDEAICKLKDFPTEKADRYIPEGTQPEVCRSRLDNPVAAETIPLDEYHFDHYLWRLDFFEIQPERPEDLRHVYSPEDYLIAYWLGRYHGFIGPEL
jgi:hypothetical protein